MPLTVRPSGRLQRVGASLLALALVLASCSSPQDPSASEVLARSDQAEVLGSSAALPGKYVSPSGNNSNAGNSPEQPYQTIAFAVKQLSAGDTLYIMEGEYFDNERPDSAIVVSNSGTPNAWITITAQPGATPILRSNQSNGIKIEGASYIEVSNLELIGNPNGGTSSYSGSGINADAIYGPAKNHHVRILNNTISGFGAGGIPITGTSHAEIRNNVIHNLAEVEWTQHSGISILESFNMGFGNDGNGYSNYITGNVVYQVENKVRDNHGRFTDGNCIIMDRTNINNYSGRTLIANNLCLDNGGRGIQIFESKHVDVVNNTVYQNLRTSEIASSGGELGAFYSTDVEFANNLVWARSGLKPARTFDSSNIRFTNNIYVANTNPEYNGASNTGDRRVDPGTSVANSPSTNPNPANFHLSSGSPAINSGTNKFNGSMPTDFGGSKRVAGGTVDIGAFESSSTAAVTPTTAPPTTAAPTTTAAPSTTEAPATTPTTNTTRPTTSSNGPTTTAAGGSSTTASGSSTTGAPTPSSAPQPTTVQRPPTTQGTASSTTQAPEIESAVAEQEADDATSAGATPPDTTRVPASGPSRSFDPTIDDADPSDDFDEEFALDGGSASAPPASPAAPTGTQASIATDGQPSPADGAAVTESNLGDDSAASAVDGESEVPDVLAFDSSPVQQPPVPLEIPLSLLLAGGLLASYYRPRWADRQLG